MGDSSRDSGVTCRFRSSLSNNSLDDTTPEGSVHAKELLAQLGVLDNETFKRQFLGGKDGGKFASTIEHTDSLRQRQRLNAHLNASGAGLEHSILHAGQVMVDASIATSSSLLHTACLQDVVKEQKKRYSGCLALVFSLIYFVTYLYAAQLYTDASINHLLENSMRQTLLPPLKHVAERADVFRWLGDIFVPMFFKQQDMYGTPLPENEWSRVLIYSQLQGAVVLEQWRSIKKRCESTLAKHLECHPQTIYSVEPFGVPMADLPPNINTSSINGDEGFRVGSGRRLRIERVENTQWFPHPGASSEAFRFFLHRTSEVSVIRNRLDYLKYRGWIDEQTSIIKVKCLVLNAELDTPRLVSVQVLFKFGRGGGIVGQVRFQTLFLSAFRSTLEVILSLVFVILTVIDTVWLGKDLVHAFRRNKVKDLIFRKVVIFFSVVCAWVLAIGFALVVWYQSSVNNKLGNLKSAGNVEKLAEDLNQAAEQTTFVSGWYDLGITYMNILLMMRCFVALKFQPRLAIVVNTLKATSIDLFHFLIIFIPTFFAYAIAGMCIFGRRVAEFASIQRAVGTCFKIGIENEFDWLTLSQEEPWMAAAWVWSFLMLICLIMLNMVLAIIMDVYSEVRNAADSNETVWQSIKLNVKRVQLWRRWVSDTIVLQKLGALHYVITIDEFFIVFPEMDEAQAEWIIEAARQKQQAINRLEGRGEAGQDMSAAIMLGLDKTLVLLQTIRDQRNSDHIKKKRCSRACIEDILQSIAVQNHWMGFVQLQIDQLREKTNKTFAEMDLPEEDFDPHSDEDEAPSRQIAASQTKKPSLADPTGGQNLSF